MIAAPDFGLGIFCAASLLCFVPLAFATLFPLLLILIRWINQDTAMRRGRTMWAVSVSVLLVLLVGSALIAVAYL